MQAAVIAIERKRLGEAEEVLVERAAPLDVVHVQRDVREAHDLRPWCLHFVALQWKRGAKDHGQCEFQSSHVGPAGKKGKYYSSKWLSVINRTISCGSSARSAMSSSSISP